MGIYCGCDTDGDWYYEVHNQASLLDTKRSRSCISCKCKIPVGGLTHKILRWRPAREGVEKIWGESGEVCLADWYLCLDCAVIYLALEKVNVCVDLGVDDLREDLAEFNRLYAPRGFQLRVQKPGW